MPRFDRPGRRTARYFQNEFQPAGRLGFALFGGRCTDCTWKGCVEARADGHDVDDAAPTDRGDALGALSLARTSRRQRLRPTPISTDQPAACATTATSLRDVAKYTCLRAGVRVVDTSNNRPEPACPSPVVPLTNDADLMKQEISKMKPHNAARRQQFRHQHPAGAGLGLARAFAGEPFTRASPYDDVNTQKVLVLLSDGRNRSSEQRYHEVRLHVATATSPTAGWAPPTTTGAAGERGREGHDGLRGGEGQRHPPLHDPASRRTISATKQDLFRGLRVAERAKAKPLYYEVPQTLRTLDERLRGHRQGSDHAAHHALSVGRSLGDTWPGASPALFLRAPTI